MTHPMPQSSPDPLARPVSASPYQIQPARLPRDSAASLPSNLPPPKSSPTKHSESAKNSIDKIKLGGAKSEGLVVRSEGNAVVQSRTWRTKRDRERMPAAGDDPASMITPDKRPPGPPLADTSPSRPRWTHLFNEESPAPASSHHRVQSGLNGTNRTSSVLPGMSSTDTVDLEGSSGIEVPTEAAEVDGEGDVVMRVFPPSGSTASEGEGKPISNGKQVEVMTEMLQRTKSRDSILLNGTQKIGLQNGHLKPKPVPLHLKLDKTSSITRADSSPLSSAPPSLPVTPRITPIQPLPLLYNLAQQSLQQSALLLQLSILPAHILIEKLESDELLLDSVQALLPPTPSSSQLKGKNLEPAPTNLPTKSELRHLYTHHLLLSLSLLQTAWNQTDQILSDREKVTVGLEVGKVGFEILEGLGRDIFLETEELSKSDKVAVKADEDGGLDSVAATKRKRSDSVDLAPAEDGVKKRKIQGKKSSSNNTETVDKAGSTKNKVKSNGKSKDEDVDMDIEVQDQSTTQDRELRRKTWKDNIRSRTKLQKDVLKDVQDIVQSACIAADKLTSGSAFKSSNSIVNGLRQELRILSCRLDFIQESNQKFAIGKLKKMKDELLKDPHQNVFVYRILMLLAEWESEGKNNDILAGASYLGELARLALQRGDPDVALVARIARARMVLVNSYHDLVDEALLDIAPMFHLDNTWSPTPPGTPKKPSADKATASKEAQKEKVTLTKIDSKDYNLLQGYMLVHYLHMRTAWESRRGNQEMAAAMLVELHQLMDNGVMESSEGSPLVNGSTTITLSPIGGVMPAPTLQLEVTMSNHLISLVYLSTCVVKHDVAGKNPKRLAFSTAGIDSISSNDDCIWNVELPFGASTAKALSCEETLLEIQADLLLDQAMASYYRSDFKSGDDSTSQLVCLLRRFSLFDTYAPRVLLLQACRAHMLGDVATATKAYKACQFKCNPGSEVDLIARVSLMLLHLGAGGNAMDRATREEVKDLQIECKQSGLAIFYIAGYLLAGITAETITSAKEILTLAYLMTLRSKNSQARALVTGVSATLFEGVADHFYLSLLEPSYKAARSLGYTSSTSQDHQVGHATLGLWLGKKLEDLFTKMDDKKAELKKQRAVNKAHEQRLLEERSE